MSHSRRPVAIASLLLPVLLSAASAQWSWQSISGPADVRSIVPGRANRLFVATVGSLLSTTNLGATWDTVSFPDPAVTDLFSMVLTGDSGRLLVASEPGVYRSSDDGASWEMLDIRLAGVYSLARDPAGRLFASGSSGVYRSTDDGASWDSVFTELGTFTDGILCTPGNHVYVASITGGLFHSPDAGESWDSLPLPGVPALVNAMAFNPGTGTLLAGLWSADLSGSRAEIRRSTDHGATWEAVHDAGQFIDALHADDAGNFYAGTLTLLRSVDDGATWQEFADGLPGSPPYAIAAIANVGGTLFAGDRSWGVTMLSAGPAAVSGPDAPQRTFALLPGYPNPFNGSARIVFSLPREEAVSVRVYDLLGREVAALLDGRMPPGMHAVRWDPGALPSGVYLTAVRTRGAFATGKLVLVR